MPAPTARSMPCSRRLRASDPTPSSLATTPSLSTGASNWPCWLYSTGSPQYIKTAYTPKSDGLISYGANIADAFRHVGVYTGRISGRAVEQVRVRHQRLDGQDAWTHRAGQAARCRRRGDRMIGRREFTAPNAIRFFVKATARNQ